MVQKNLQIKRGCGRPWQSGDELVSDGPERAFVSEKFMLIPEDTELPPDYIQKW